MEPQVKAAHVYAAITAVRAALAKTGIGKTRENTFQNFKFRGIDEVYNATSALLAEHGLCILPSYSEREQLERTNDKGKPLFWVSLRGSFAFVSAIDGSSHTVVTYGEAFDSADKATNKAMSMAMKNAVLQAFTVPTEGDNDADGSHHDVAAKPFTAKEQELLAGLHTASGEGFKAFKAAWQKLDVETRRRFASERDKLVEIAEKNDAEMAKAQAKSAETGVPAEVAA